MLSLILAMKRAVNRKYQIAAALLLSGVGAALPSAAAVTDIGAEPVITQANVTAKPNLLFLLDNSGSMAWDFMPDDMGDTGSGTGTSTAYGYRASQCNGVAYDPTYTYTPPLTSTGSSYSNATFTGAWNDGYVGGTSTTNLSGSTTTSDTSSTSNTTGTGSKSFAVSDSSFYSGSFVIGTAATITGSSGSRTMSGAVTAWTNTSGNNWTLTVNVTSASGTASASTSWTVSQTTDAYYYFTYSGAQTAMNWTYTTAGAVDTTTTYYKECNSNIGSTPGSGVFTKVLVSSLTTAQQSNYANWFSYYRKRYLLMRTAVGQAFSSFDSGYRVGFTTIGDTSAVDGTNSFRDTKDFDTTQKANFYSSLYSVTPSGSTPLRQALSKAGQYFAKQVSGQTYDPMVYSCQRNFALLSTDGYWNGNYGYMLDNSTKVGNQDGSEVRPMLDGATAQTTYSRNQYTAASSTQCSSGQYRVSVTPQTNTTSATATSWTSGSVSRSCVSSSTVVVNNLTAAQLVSAGPAYDTVVTTSGTTGGSADALSDVAEYYYKTDLRTSALGNCTSSSSGAARDVCANTVPVSTRDPNTFQHMSTFTIGLGVGGTLTYDPNYLTQTSGDYVNLTNGTLNWPIPGNTQSTSGSGGDARNVDDLWHTAVDGRGIYYSARSASALGAAISGVVTAVQEINGSGSAGATSTTTLVSGTSNQIFEASYHTVSWTGELVAYSVDGATGAIGSTASWSAQTLLDNAAATSRNIYYRQSASSAVLRAFNYANLTADSLGGNFSSFCSKPVVPTQCAGLTSANAALANDGTKLVDYLRGVRTYEATNNTSPLFRTRSHVLGDIIGGAPAYVGKPPFAYADAGYSDFVTLKSSRTPMVYVGANDGMLHAFNASTGAEAWAYVPTPVMSNMYKLANAGYATGHQYFVDGAPVVGDIKVGSTWKTVLVGGLNGGGKYYYALDITDPANPVSLWEFTETNMGLTYGNPVITKRADGTWVVAFTSGYNNPDGLGHLYLVNANSGAQLLNISTSAGTAATPSGLAQINAWIDAISDNTAKRFYGGDVLGNLWRFDTDNLVAPNQSAMLLAQFQAPNGTAQPVTTQPLTALVSGQYPVIVVGTGRYLGTSDITDTTVQSIYAVKDSLASTGLGVVRNNSAMVQQTITANNTTNTATMTGNSVPWSTKSGWWVDLPNSGERIALDMLLQSGTLVAASAIPSGDACTSGGASWLYTINLTTGSAPGAVGTKISSSAVVVGLSLVKLSTGSSAVFVKTSDGGGGGAGHLTAVASSGISIPRRTSWRELTN
ncbi:MAG: PilC/PilY family type IV pilus protein [Pseudomonadota bacterium]